MSEPKNQTKQLKENLKIEIKQPQIKLDFKFIILIFLILNISYDRDNREDYCYFSYIQTDLLTMHRWTL